MKVGRIRSLVVATMVAGLVVGIAGSASAVTTVNGVGMHWSPSSVTINTNGTVKWHSSSGNHFLKAYGGNWTISKRLNQGASVKRKFTHNGTFKFYCTIHGSVVGGVCTGMCGKVVVH